MILEEVDCLNRWKKVVMAFVVALTVALFAPAIPILHSQHTYCNGNACMNVIEYESLTHFAFCIGGVYVTSGQYRFDWGCLRFA